jgi:hypothetical protein
MEARPGAALFSGTPPVPGQYGFSGSARDAFGEIRWEFSVTAS